MSRAPTVALDANEVRKDFELSMIFGIEGVPHGEGCLCRKSNGHYVDDRVENAWRGYLACASSKHAKLERFAHDRFIGNGDRTALREVLGLEGHSDAALDDLVRFILKHFGGIPA